MPHVIQGETSRTWQQIAILRMRQLLFGIFVIQRRQPQLFHIVLARSTPRGFAGRLDGRQKKRDENADDCDHDEELNERKSASTTHVRRFFPGAASWWLISHNCVPCQSV